MTADAPRRLEGLFAAARELPSEQWTSFLRDECGEDTRLFAEVLTLLRHSAEAEELERPADVQLTELTRALQPPSAEATPGDSTEPRYTTQKLYAQGGLGEVWLARDRDLRRDVALKRLQARYADQSSVAARFLREAEVTGQLGHPNIVPVYEIGYDTEERPFYTMRLVEGRTLTEEIAGYHQRRQGNGETAGKLRQLLGAFVSVGQAIAYAHSRGVLHRDLKPVNVVLGEFGEVIVLDWGLAKIIGESGDEATAVDLSDHAAADLTDGIMGTPSYMAPEQATGREADVRTDIFGLGTILFEILTGRPPHLTGEAESVAEFVQRIREEAPVAARSVNSTVPRALEAICSKALSLDPAKRYQAAGDLVADVQHWLSDEPVSAHVESAWERAARWARRHRTWVQSGAVALVLITAVSVTAAVLVTGAWQRESTALEAEKTERDRADENAATALAEAARARRELYTSRIRHVANALRRRDVAGAQQLLASLEPAAFGEDLRGFEWFYLRRLCQRYWKRLPCHSLGVAGVRFSGDGRVLLTVGYNDDNLGEAKYWDVWSGEELGRVEFAGSELMACAVNRDGSRAAIGFEDGTVRWIERGASKSTLLGDHNARVTCLSFSADGTRLAIGDEQGRLSFWKVASSERMATVNAHAARVRYVGFFGQGREVISWGEVAFADNGELLPEGIKLWDADSGTLRRTILESSAVESFGITRRGTAAVVKDQRAQSQSLLWRFDISLERPVGVLQALGNDPASSVGISATGGTLAVHAGTSVVSLISTVFDEQLGDLPHPDVVWDLDWAPQGTVVATACNDGHVYLWDAAEMLTLYGPADSLGGAWYDLPTPLELSISADARLAAVGNAGGVRVFSVPVPVERSAFSPAAPTVTGEVETLWTSRPTFFTGADRLLVVDPDQGPGARVGPFRVRECEPWETTPRRVLEGSNVSPDKFVVSANDRWCAFTCRGTEPPTLELWSLTPWRRVARIVRRAEMRTLILASRESPNDFLLVDGDGAVDYWRGKTGTVERHWPGDAAAADVTAATFGAKGQTLIVGDVAGNIRVLDMAERQTVREFHGHSDAIIGVALTPDGRRLASTGGEGLLKLWDLQTAEELLVLGPQEGATLGENALSFLQFADDGRSLVAWGHGGPLQLLTTRTGEQLSWQTVPGAELLQQTLDLTVKHQRLDSVLTRVGEQVGCKVGPDYRTLSEDQLIAEHIDGRLQGTLAEVLERLLAPLGYTYRIIRLQQTGEPPETVIVLSRL